MYQKYWSVTATLDLQNCFSYFFQRFTLQLRKALNNKHESVNKKPHVYGTASVKTGSSQTSPRPKQGSLRRTNSIIFSSIAKLIQRKPFKVAFPLFAVLLDGAARGKQSRVEGGNDKDTDKRELNGHARQIEKTFKKKTIQVQKQIQQQASQNRRMKKRAESAVSRFNRKADKFILIEIGLKHSYRFFLPTFH